MTSVTLVAVAALLATSSTTGAEEMTAFNMRKGVTVTLTGANTTGQFRKGDFVVQPGCAADAVRFKMRVTLANSGSARVLTAAEKLAFMTSFDCTVKHGASFQFTPYSKMDFKRAHELTRNGRASTWEGYNDTSTGLGQSIGSSTDVVLWPRIPFSAFWQEAKFADLWRVGSLQAQGISIDVRRLAAVLPSGFSISGNVLLDIIPDESPARYELYSPIPRYVEWEESNRIATTVPSGLPFFLAERTAVHASTSLTTVRLACDALTMYEQVSLSEVITRYNDTLVYFPSEAAITDEVTLLYAIPPGVRLAEVPTGKLLFEQQVQSLGTMALAWYGIEQMTESQAAAEAQALANAAGATVSCVNVATVMGLEEIPKNLRFAMPWVVFRQGEKEFDMFPGLVATPGGSAVVPAVPESVKLRARAVRNTHVAAGEHRAAENVTETVALALPGTSGPRGLKGGGSPMLERVRPAIES